MKKIGLSILAVIILGITGFTIKKTNKGSRIDESIIIEKLIKEMTLDEKLEQLSGYKETGPIPGVLRGFETPDNERLNIPGLKVTDGPVGIRWGKNTVFPAGVSLAATWNRDLLYRVGEALSREAKVNGRNYVLGGCVNIHRLPTGGRNFESYGEDPFLSSEMLVSYLKGMQSVDGIVSCVKHFACNNMEWDRKNIDMIVDERTLREIYLPMFKAAVKKANVHSVMAAYNLVNGQHCSENKHLINEILKDEWGFKGFVVSDWVSTYSTIDAANNGLDMENPLGDYFSLDNLKAGINSGNISKKVIDDKIRRILWAKQQANMLDGEYSKTKNGYNDAHNKLALQTARESIVLLKNDDILPLNNAESIAVIGPNGNIARTGGGGSSNVTPKNAPSFLEMLKKQAEPNTNIKFSQGDKLRTIEIDIIPFDYFKTGKQTGWKAEYFNNTKLEGKPVLTKIDSIIDFMWGDIAPVPEVKNDSFSVRWSTTFTAPTSGEYVFKLNCDDGANLYFNNKKVIDNWGQHSEVLKSYSVDLIKGQQIDMRIDYCEIWMGATVQLGWITPKGFKAPNHSIDDAVKVSKNVEYVILCLGYADFLEGEEMDRNSMNLPYKQEELIQKVTAANTNTIVIINSGGPVNMNYWKDKTKAIIQAFYPGQDGSNALTEIILGKENPSGKLPFSYITDESQTTVYKDYMDESRHVYYDEGIFVGYRFLEKNNIEPAFPFGHGLSYTNFEYSHLKIKKKGLEVIVSFTISNTGNFDGRETAQIYINDKESSLPRPVKELKGFEKVFLKSGESISVKITLNNEAFAFYHPQKKQWIVEPGEFDIMIGSSSSDIRLCQIIEF